jgi:anti-sigma-K factor RskA
MHEEDDIDGLAAEYVLGSLGPSERAAVAARRLNDARLANAIEAWERRLAPLAERLPDLEPPPELFDLILQRIAVPRAEVVLLRRHARRWRGIAAAATLMAASLALAVGWFLYERAGEPTVLVAELYRSAGTSTADEIMNPAFVVSLETRACKVTARPVTVQPRPGRNYQLWLLRPGATQPQSLGVLASAEPLTASCPTPLPAAALAQATLAISQEPDGGSPTGAPTGPMAFVGKLMAVGQRPAGGRTR